MNDVREVRAVFRTGDVELHVVRADDSDKFLFNVAINGHETALSILLDGKQIDVLAAFLESAS